MTDGGPKRMQTLRVWRGNAAGGAEKEYQVPIEEGMVVLDAIHWIQAHEDSDLACRWNCKAAKCGSCSAEVNGKPALMCKSRLDEFEGKVVKVHPIKAFPPIKDLVTDVSWNYHVNRQIPGFQSTDPAPLKMAQRDVDRIQEFRKCIECFLCQDVCHVLRDHKRFDGFYGPRFMVRIAGLEMHPKDGVDRAALLKKDAGVGFCNITKCCTEVCPEHIKITDNAIIPLKERVVNRYYDPLLMLVRTVTGRGKKEPKTT